MTSPSRFFVIVGMFLMALVICLYLVFCPIIKKFPTLTGLYKVGLVTVHTEDTARKETLAEPHEDGGNRHLTLHIWYPAHIDGTCRQTKYLAGKMPFLRKAFAVEYPKLAPFADWLLSDITTYACRDANVSREKEKYPIILFSHGLLGLSSDSYAPLLEELASHGFMVVGIDHTYLNLATLSAQGILHSSAALSAKFAQMSVAEQEAFQTMAINMYKADVHYVLDVLKRYDDDQHSQFYHKFDLERIGIMGHSAGGTAALEISRTEPRLKACINLDGWYDHVISWELMPIPTLLLFGSVSREVTEPTEEYLKRKGLTREQYYERENRIEEHMKRICDAQNCTLRIIEGANHGDFGGPFFKWPLRPWNARECYGLIREINGLIVAFLKKYL